MDTKRSGSPDPEGDTEVSLSNRQFRMCDKAIEQGGAFHALALKTLTFDQSHLSLRLIYQTISDLEITVVLN